MSHNAIVQIQTIAPALANLLRRFASGILFMEQFINSPIALMLLHLLRYARRDSRYARHEVMMFL